MDTAHTEPRRFATSSHAHPEEHFEVSILSYSVSLRDFSFCRMVYCPVVKRIELADTSNNLSYMFTS